MYAVVYQWSWYCEPYGFYNSELEAHRFLRLAVLARPNAIVKVIKV